MVALVDANGNRTRWACPPKHAADTVRRWKRDVLGRATREIRADGATDTHYTYDLAGRVKTVTYPMDQVPTRLVT